MWQLWITDGDLLLKPLGPKLPVVILVCFFWVNNIIHCLIVSESTHCPLYLTKIVLYLFMSHLFI